MTLQQWQEASIMWLEWAAHTSMHHQRWTGRTTFTVFCCCGGHSNSVRTPSVITLQSDTQILLFRLPSAQTGARRSQCVERSPGELGALQMSRTELWGDFLLKLTKIGPPTRLEDTQRRLWETIYHPKRVYTVGNCNIFIPTCQHDFKFNQDWPDGARSSRSWLCPCLLWVIPGEFI